MNTNITCDVLPELEESELLTAGCIILEDDVTLDCDGFSIIGPGIDQPGVYPIPDLVDGINVVPDLYAGINVARKHNVRIKNCIVENFPVGIRSATPFSGPSGSAVIESSSVSNNWIGIATGGKTTLKKVGVEYNKNVGISFAGITDQVVLDNVYSCFNDNLDIETGRETFRAFDAALLDTCVEATGQIFAGTTDGTANICPNNDRQDIVFPFNLRGSIAGVINFSLDENGDGPITSCDDLFAQQGILFENDGTRAPTPVVPDPFITDEGEPCLSSRAEDINAGCEGPTRSFGTISFGETIQGTTSAFQETEGGPLFSDRDQFKFSHRGGSISATLETSFRGLTFRLCPVEIFGGRAGCNAISGLSSGGTLIQGCAQDNAGAVDDPNSFAFTGDFVAGEYVLEVAPQRSTSDILNPLLSLECGGNEGTYNVTLIEGPTDISPRITPIQL